MKFVRARKTAGVGLMAASLMAGIIAAPAALAAEAEVPDDAAEVEIERQAFWQANRSKFVDNAATSQFPPQAVCLVAPNACFFPEGDQDPSGGLELGTKGNETTAAISKQEQELLATMAEEDEGDPEAPVEEGDHPVSIAFGESNYRSAIEFPLPSLPDGEVVDSFTMVLTQGDPTYANESPAFRQAVLAALTCAREDPETPGLERCTIEEFEKIPDADLRDDTHLSVEACPITSEWEEGRAQDEDTLPEVNCLFTARGVPVEVEDEIVWVFDLSFAAQAWYDGTLEQNGLLIAPGGAENLAYGDEEQTYSKQVTFTAQVKIAMASSPAPEPPPAPPAPEPFTGSSFGSSDPFGIPPGTSSGGSFSSPGSSSPSQPSTDQPAVSEPTDTAEVAPQEPPTLAAGTPLGNPETPWWLWLLVPIFLAGAWLLSRSLEEEAVLASERGGAMTRLLERHGATSTDSLVTG